MSKIELDEGVVLRVIPEAQLDSRFTESVRWSHMGWFEKIHEYARKYGCMLECATTPEKYGHAPLFTVSLRLTNEDTRANLETRSTDTDKNVARRCAARTLFRQLQNSWVWYPPNPRPDSVQRDECDRRLIVSPSYFSY